jgi:(2Fe-2S) ferredoxin
MTIEQLNLIKNQYVKNIEQRQIHKDASYNGKFQILVCASTGCISGRSMDVIKRFEQKIKEVGLQARADVVPTGCHGLCEMGPVVIIYPQGAFYAKVKVEDVDRIVDSHLIKNEIVQDKLF